MSSFIGEMIWFTGVVESTNDPLEQGRLKVRCYGYHTDDKTALPTIDLPWAIPILPITSSSMAGVGQSATGVERGSWVVGFFKDGKAAQDPVVFGTIPTSSTKTSNLFGFSDPRGLNPKRNGADIPRNATSSFQKTPLYVKREETRIENVDIAKGLNLSTLEDEVEITRESWSSIPTEEVVNSSYPNNHVTEYASGHVIEVDDTTGYERISHTHKSGTYHEMSVNGDRTLNVRGEDYEIYARGKNVSITGNCNLTIGGNLNTLVRGDYNLEVEGDYNISVGKVLSENEDTIPSTMRIKTLGNFFKEVLKDNGETITGNNLIKISGNEKKSISGNLTHDIIGNSGYTTLGTNTSVALLNQKIVGDAGVAIGTSNSVNINVGSNIRLDADNNINIIAGEYIVEEGAAIYMN